MNPALLTPEIQQFIDAHLHDEPARLLLKKSPFPGISMQEIAQQVKGKQKCRRKLPLWYRTPGIYYPPSLALEQCSSELTGAYKASLCAGGGKGDTLADLTGGAGVDSYFFSKHVREVIHVEQSADLSAIAAHNLPLLGARNIRFICGNGLDILSQRASSDLDWIYLDPSRRGRRQQKVFLPRDYEPDFIPHLEPLVAAAGQVMIKTSPLVDLSYGIDAFRFVREIHVVAVKNECREILWVLERQPPSQAKITCAALNGKETDRFSFTIAGEAALPPTPLSKPLTYLYEPGAAILKAGAFKTIGARFGIAKLHVNSHLYTSGKFIDGFPGRAYRLLECLSVKEFSKHYKGGKINLSTRNFPTSAEALGKKYRITPGGDDQAIFTTLAGKHLVLICRKAK